MFNNNNNTSIIITIQVADFGMSRDLEENNYYVSQGGLIPIKWTAPEVRTSLFQGCTEQWNSHNAISLSFSVTITVNK